MGMEGWNRDPCILQIPWGKSIKRGFARKKKICLPENGKNKRAVDFRIGFILGKNSPLKTYNQSLAIIFIALCLHSILWNLTRGKTWKILLWNNTCEGNIPSYKKSDKGIKEK